MKHSCKFLHSSIGKKFTVGAAGVLLCLFLVFHLSGNMLLFVGESQFNAFANTLDTNPLIPAAEIILAAIFFAHVVVSLWLRWQNKQARPVGYADYRAKGGRTAGSRTMTWTALLVLAFLIIHVKAFRFGGRDGGMYHLVLSSLSNPYMAGFYLLALAGLALHLSHGVQSAFQTFGLNHPKYMPAVKALGWAFALIICGGFAVIPIWALIKGGL